MAAALRLLPLVALLLSSAALRAAGIYSVNGQYYNVEGCVGSPEQLRYASVSSCAPVNCTTASNGAYETRCTDKADPYTDGLYWFTDVFNNAQCLGEIISTNAYITDRCVQPSSLASLFVNCSATEYTYVSCQEGGCAGRSCVSFTAPLDVCAPNGSGRSVRYSCRRRT